MMTRTASLVMSLLASTAMAATPEHSQTKTEKPAVHETMTGEPHADIQFTLGSSRMPVTANTSLASIAEWSRKNPVGLVVLDSHASGQPKPATELALRRAETVRDDLIARGVKPERIVIAAFTEDTKIEPRVSVWTTQLARDKVFALRSNATAILWGPGTLHLPTQTARR